jgi:hypothetical protein
MVDYDPTTAAPAQVLPFEDLPSTDTPVTAAWLNHLNTVLADVAGNNARLETAEAAITGKQSSDADLTTIAALDSTTAGALVTDGSGWIRKTYAQLKTALSLVKGDVGLGNVDNTADTAKPVSTAQQTALDGKAATSHTHGVTDLTATGTKNGTKFLRDDNTWQVPSGGGGSTGALSGQVARSGGYVAALGTVSAGTITGTARATPIALATSGTADRIGIEVTTLQASSTINLGIYNEDTATGLPGTLVLDAGTVDSSSTGFKEITISQSLAAGRYWLVCRTAGGTSPSTRTMTTTYNIPYVSNQTDLQSTFAGVSGGSGTLPSTFAVSGIASVVGRVYLRFA